jgi:hypothetical protein
MDLAGLEAPALAVGHCGLLVEMRGGPSFLSTLLG